MIIPSTVAIISLFLGTPLHIISTGDTPYVTAALSLINGVLNEDAHLVTWSADRQGNHFFTADENNFYLAVDADNNIVALTGDVSSNEGYINSFREEIIDGVQDLRYYVESDGKKYYMMAQPNGDVTTLPAEDLVLGSTDDNQSRFRTVV